jgi:hypothetical protein
LSDGTWRSTIKGDVFRIKEWYGWNGQPNKGTNLLASEITEGIIQREIDWEWRRRRENWCRVKSGIADAQIFAAENGNCIATDMKVKCRLDDGHKYPGIQWIASDKRPGSRKTGWSQMRKMIKQAHPSKLGPREFPGLFITTECKQFIRTVPVLPRDEKDMDDVNTEAEDHIADETRYFIRSVGQIGGSGSTSGNF